MDGNIFKIIKKLLCSKKKKTEKTVAKPNDVLRRYERRYEEIGPAMQFPLVVGHQCCVAVQKGIMIRKDILQPRKIKKFCRMWIPLVQTVPIKRKPSAGATPTTGYCVSTSLKWIDVPAEGSKPKMAANLIKTETMDNQPPICLGDDKKRLLRSIGTCTHGQMLSVGCQYKEYQQDKSCQTSDRTWDQEYCQLNSSCVGSPTCDMMFGTVCQYEEYQHNKMCQTSAYLTGIRSQEPGTSHQYHIAYPMTLADLRIKQRKFGLLLYAKEIF